MVKGAAAQSLVLKYSSVNGANYLGEVLALVNTGLSGPGAFSCMRRMRAGW
jgi:hypothetical protein